MASSIPTLKLVFALLSSFAIARTALAGDDGNFYTYTGLRSKPQNPLTVTISKATMVEFPALKDQSVSLAVIQFPASGTNPPHSHPHSAELLYVLSGRLRVGFVDTANKLFTQTLQAGDSFVFPKGLVHFQINTDAKIPAETISAFGSANAGTVKLTKSLFNTNINDDALAKSFKTDVATVQTLKPNLASI